MQFRLYADETGGSAIWTESHTVDLDSGYFSLQLGSETEFPADAFDGSMRYLSVQVSTDEEMDPRQPVSSVPYAMHAATADSAGVADSATVAESVAWGGLSGFPALCSAAQRLRGFDAEGAPVCVTPAPPALTCSVVNATETGATIADVTCPNGTTVTGGGCTAGSGSLVQSRIFAPNGWHCVQSAAGTVRAYAHCCSVQ